MKVHVEPCVASKSSVPLLSRSPQILAAERRMHTFRANYRFFLSPLAACAAVVLGNDQISKLGREPTIKSAEFGESCVLARQKLVF